MQRQLLIEYLERRRATFFRERHLAAYTAARVAEASHIDCQNFAKVVMVKIDGELAMIVLPAHCYLNLDALRVELGAERIVLAREHEFDYRFPRCESGAMPPFGHLFGLQTYLVPLFEEGGLIAFSAGSHSELIRMPLAEYLQLAYVDEVSSAVASTTPSSISSGSQYPVPAGLGVAGFV